MYARVFISILVVQGAALAQAKFEVASVKVAPFFTAADLTAGRVQRPGITIGPVRAEFRFLPLEALIAEAYQVSRKQVVGASAIATQPFDIVARIPEGANKAQVPEMLRSLLADRWRLKVHREQKEERVYALIRVEGSPELPGAAQAADDEMRVEKAPGGGMRMQAANMTMARLAVGLSGIFDRPVVDMTGLKGSYRFVLELPENGHAESDAFLRRLGLRLEARKLPLERIVVDHAEKLPSAT